MSSLTSQSMVNLLIRFILMRY